MSEDEATEKLKELVARCKECKFATCENCEINWNEVQAIEKILHLYQQKKERIEELEKRLEEKEKEVVLVPEGTCFVKVPKDVISKDKIRAKIKELEEKSDYWNCDEIEVLKELLKEN